MANNNQNRTILPHIVQKMAILPNFRKSCNFAGNWILLNGICSPLLLLLVLSLLLLRLLPPLRCVPYSKDRLYLKVSLTVGYAQLVRPPLIFSLPSHIHLPSLRCSTAWLLPRTVYEPSWPGWQGSVLSGWSTSSCPAVEGPAGRSPALLLIFRLEDILQLSQLMFN